MLKVREQVTAACPVVSAGPLKATLYSENACVIVAGRVVSVDVALLFVWDAVTRTMSPGNVASGVSRKWVC